MFKSTLLAGALLTVAASAYAHFGIVIPNHATVTDKADSTLSLNIAFAHPMERQGMTMEKPNAFYVVRDGEKTDLLPTLNATKLFGKEAWKAPYKVNRPGVYQFVVEPKPYWEPAEDKFIIHYTKVVVPAYGDEEGWDKPIGVKTEIVPLTRPFANWSGNTFQGQVLLEGKPVANCDVEVEYYNPDGARKTPNPYFVTQVVKTDANGVFTYSAPWAGWWGFAALNDGPEKLPLNGKAKDVELGAVLWTEFTQP